MLSVTNGPEILSVPLKDIFVIKYNMEIGKIWFQYRIENLGSPKEFLVVLTSELKYDVRILQSCCYSLVKHREPRKSCDKESVEFFMEKARVLLNHNRRRQHFVPQKANRGQDAKQKAKTLKPFLQTRLDSMVSESTLADSLQNTPSRSSTADDQSLRGTGSRKHSIVPDSSSRKAPKAKSKKTLAATSPVKSRRIDHRVTMTAASPEHLYYCIAPETDNLLPVSIYDKVIRMRGEKERTRGGKRDKFDVFDGPWYIMKFDTPDKTYSVVPETIEPKSDRYCYTLHSRPISRSRVS